MKSNLSRVLCLAMATWALAGCGGGGSAPLAVAPPVPAPAPAPSAAVLRGTAAVGSALPNAPVTITDSTGASPCVESNITTDAFGSYTCTLKSGETAPFFVVITDPTGDTPPMASVSTVTPPAGSNLTINVTPLTTAIVAQLVSPPNALAVVASGTVDATALAAVTANVTAQLAPVLAAIAPDGSLANYDPFTTSITAATAGQTGNTADLVLDVVKVSTDPATGLPSLSTVDNPTPILLATPTTSGSTLATPTTSVSLLSQFAQSAAQALQACFAQPLATRTLSTDTTLSASQGGPMATVAANCTSLVPDGNTTVPAGDYALGGVLGTSSAATTMTFVHNGFRFGQLLYKYFTSDAMTGARFSVPETVLFIPGSTASGASTFQSWDRAVLNFRFVDSAGNPGNFITVAALIPGTASAANPTGWWLTGNQDAVDVTFRTLIRRVVQLNPGGKQFQSGFQILVSAHGPGSVDAASHPLTAARVKGPGLPAGGIMYATSTVNGSLTYMDLANKTGDPTTLSECGNGGTTVNCPNLMLELTTSSASTTTATLMTNPNAFTWAQAADGFDATQFRRGNVYTFEFFYGGSTTPTLSFRKVLLTDRVPAVQGLFLPWNDAGSLTLGLLDPLGSLAGAQAAPTVDWVQNASAERIAAVAGMVNTSSGIFGPSIAVATGATSVTLTGETVPAFSTSSARAFLFSYRMLDGSGKQMVYRYN